MIIFRCGIFITSVAVIVTVIVVNLPMMVNFFCLHWLILLLSGIVQSLLDRILLLLSGLEEHHCDLLGSFSRDHLLLLTVAWLLLDLTFTIVDRKLLNLISSSSSFSLVVVSILRGQINLVEKVTDCGEWDHDVAEFVQGALGLLVLFLSFDQLLCVHLYSLLLLNFSRCVQVTRSWTSSISSDLDFFRFGLALLGLFKNLKLRAHEWLFDSLKSDFFAPQTSLLLLLLLDNLSFDLALSHFFGGCDRAIQVKPNFFAVFEDQLA